MNYIIIETQTTGNSTAVLTFVENDYFNAMGKYFEKCAAAARSNVELHAVSLITENGAPVANKHEAFYHTPIETEE